MSEPKLQGIVPPMVTPLLGRDELDVAGLEKLIEHILAGGVHGLFILGTTGEGQSLSHRLRRALVERTCRQVRKRVPVLVGITDAAFVESVNFARQAADAGADAVVIAPPYHMPEGQQELLVYLDHLMTELPLPLFLYNMPPLTKVAFEIETVRRAMDHPRIAGFKDSSGNMAYFQSVLDLLKHRPDWSVLMGPEKLLADALRAGGHGGVSGGANVFPRLYVSFFEAMSSGDSARADALYAQVLRVGARLYRIGRHPSSVIKGIKCALSVLGVCNDFMAEPFQRHRAGERVLIEKNVRELVELAGEITMTQ